MEAAAVALKAAVVAPAATVADTGTVSEALLLESVTLDPPAVGVKVTVHALAAPCPRLVGLHTTPDTSSGATRLIATVFELVPTVAVTVAL